MKEEKIEKEEEQEEGQKEKPRYEKPRSDAFDFSRAPRDGGGAEYTV